MKEKDKVSGLTGRENLKTENELLKIKLTAEFGMKDMKSDLPDELENEWLNYIYDFEKLHKDAKEISVYERLGNPECKKISVMSDEEVNLELKHLINLMEQNHLILNFLCDYSDRVKYEFITEELFEEKISDIRIEGMRTNFIYEEFHQNHEYDIKDAVNGFFKFFLNPQFNEEHIGFILLNEMIRYKDKTISKEDYIKILMCFRDEVMPAGAELIEFYSITFDWEKEIGSVSGEISFSVLENGLPSAHVSDEFKIDFVFDEYNYWIISEISFP